MARVNVTVQKSALLSSVFAPWILSGGLKVHQYYGRGGSEPTVLIQIQQIPVINRVPLGPAMPTHLSYGGCSCCDRLSGPLGRRMLVGLSR